MMSFFEKPWNGHNPQPFNRVYSADDFLWVVLLFLVFWEMKIIKSENIDLEQYHGNTFYLARHHEGSSVLTLNSCPSLCTGKSWHPNLSLPSSGPRTVSGAAGTHWWHPCSLHPLQRASWEKLCTYFKAVFSWRDIAHKHHLPTLQVGLSCI